MRQKQSSSNFALNPFAPDFFTYGSRIDAIGCMVAQLLQAQLLQATAPPMTYMPPEPPVTYMAPSVVEQPSEIGATMDSGFVQRIKVPGMHMEVHEHATSTINQGTQTEVAAQTVHMEPTQAVMGQTQQDVRESYTTQVIESFQQEPEMLVRQVVHEVPPIAHEPLEQIVDSDGDSFHSVPEGAWWTDQDLENLCRMTAEQTATITTERLTEGIEAFRSQVQCRLAEKCCEIVSVETS